MNIIIRERQRDYESHTHTHTHTHTYFGSKNIPRTLFFIARVAPPSRKFQRAAYLRTISSFWKIRWHGMAVARTFSFVLCYMGMRGCAFLFLSFSLSLSLSFSRLFCSPQSAVKCWTFAPIRVNISTEDAHRRHGDINLFCATAMVLLARRFCGADERVRKNAPLRPRIWNTASGVSRMDAVTGKLRVEKRGRD